MKIGIITFHWGANHGAVLQVYALSQYLCMKYHADVEIIDYQPKNLEYTVFNAIKQCRPRAIIQKLKENRKEQKIKKFRKRLKLSKRYYTNAELINSGACYDILITGSDQIWNPSFLRYGEGKTTPVYFLNFGNVNTKKISVSASFGCEKFPEECQKIVKPLLEQFQDISVREKTGKNILKNMQICSTVTADPTSLLSKECYLKLCCSDYRAEKKYISKMILRSQTKEVRKLIDAICASYELKNIKDIEYLTINEWLTAIRDSYIVITNSFHCVMMCLKLHTPFVVILEKGNMAGMNDRFTTLLEKFKLTDRIVNSIEDIKKVPVQINFQMIDIMMEKYTESLRVFLERNITE